MESFKKIPKIKMYGPSNIKDRTAVLSFTIGNMDSSHIRFLLEREFGIATRAGLHCTPLAHQTIGTLEQGACRLSPGFFNTEQEMGSRHKRHRNNWKKSININ